MAVHRDDSLIVAASDAFLAHYEAAAPALRAWAVLKCRGPLGKAVGAEDLEQEVCLEAWRAYPRYDVDRGAFRPWLFGVASRVAAEALRQLARGRLLPGSALSRGHADHLPAQLTTISRRARRDEALEHLLSDLEQLADEERQLFVYRGLEGLAHEQVAELLGISAEAAGKKWQRLRQRLQGFPSARLLFGEN